MKGIEESMAYNFEFEIKRFGPIDHGKITTKPLMLFIGPNGSGKSYIAMLLQSIFNSHTRSEQNASILINSFFEKATDTDFALNYLNKNPKIIEQIKDLKKNPENIPLESIEPFVDNILKTLYEDRLGRELSYAFSSPLDDLIQIGKDSFQIETNMESYSACMIYNKGDNLTLKKHTPIKVNLEGQELFMNILKNIEPTSGSSSEVVRAFLTLVYSAVVIFSLGTVEFLTNSCYYLPAARSGIIAVRKKILTDEYKKNPFSSSKPIQDQQLSGAVSSFIYNIHNLPEEKGPLYNLAKEFEREIIRGEIVRSMPEEHTYPDIKYNYLGREIPLHVVSSTVSELAPIILYLKYIVKPGDILVIEEPEAHLHPKNQIILAKYLARLIRKGVKLIITTHSEFLLEKLNNLISLSKIDPNKRKEFNHETDDYLLPTEISAYLFEETNPGIYKINELTVTEENGISEREFSKVVNLLYEEEISLNQECDS